MHDMNYLLNHHSLKYIEMALSADRIEKVTDPDGYGKHTGECGDTVEFFLQMDKSRLGAVSFWTQGCLDTRACCNTVARLNEGKSIDQAWAFVPEQVVEYLETLEQDHLHCADLAAGAFYRALSDLTARMKRQTQR